MATETLLPNGTPFGTTAYIAGYDDAHEALRPEVAADYYPLVNYSYTSVIWLKYPDHGTSRVDTVIDFAGFTLSSDNYVTQITVYTYSRKSDFSTPTFNLFLRSSLGEIEYAKGVSASTGWSVHTIYPGQNGAPSVITQSHIDNFRVTLGLQFGSAVADETISADNLYIVFSLASRKEKSIGGSYNVAWFYKKSAAYTVGGTFPKQLLTKYYVYTAPGTTTFTQAIEEGHTPAVSNPWRPVLAPSSFYLGTEQYYTYAKKRTRTLEDITVSVFQLAGVPLSTTLTVTYDGIAYTDFWHEGSELHLKHRNPEEWAAFYIANSADAKQLAYMNSGFMGSPDNIISVSFDFLTWNESNKDFDVQSITQTLTIVDDEDHRYYRIYDNDVGEDILRASGSAYAEQVYKWYGPRNGPTVITDDNIENSDSIGTVPEFAIEPETGLVVFGRTNLFVNPGVEIISPSSTVYGWKDSADTENITATDGSFPNEACYGNWYIAMSTSDVVQQVVKIPDAGPYTLSFYARSGGSPTITAVLNPIDISGDYIDSTGASVGTPFDLLVETYTHDVSISGDTWTRYTVSIGPEHTFFTPDVVALPEEAVRLEVRLVADGSVDIDAIQLESGYHATQFIGLHGNATVEYEANPAGNYVPAPDITELHPYRRDDVDLNPAQAEMSNGFLCWLDDGGSTDFQLGRGGKNIYHDGAGPADVLGRYHTPYAKVTGFNKLRQRQTFHISGTPITDEIAPSREILVCTSMSVVLPDNSYFGPPPLFSANGSSLGATYWIAGGIGAQYNPSDDIRVQTSAGKITLLSVIALDQFDNPLLGSTVTVTKYYASGSSSEAPVTNRAGQVTYEHGLEVGSTGRACETVVFTCGSVSLTYTIDAV